MTESADRKLWESDRPDLMLTWLRATGKITDRKLRLFACACARSCWQSLTDKSSRAAVEVAEKYADGKATNADRYMCSKSAYWASEGESYLAWLTLTEPLNVVELAVHHVVRDKAPLLRHIVGNPFRPVTVCGLKRKPFHNQYAHVDAYGGFWLEPECPFCAELRTPTVLSLAAALYDGGDCAAALCDALQESGAPAELAEHFRPRGEKCRHCGGNGSLTGWNLLVSTTAAITRTCPACSGRGFTGGEWADHPRGCWALDTVLGKE